MEEHKMLALSTGHLTEKTCNMLGNIEGIIGYNKGGYGWFVYVPEYLNELGHIPADIYACLKLALEGKYDWIMFDRDVEVINELPVYEW